MQRRDSIKSLAGIGLFTLMGKAHSASMAPFLRMPNCTLTPAETEGPYYINANLLRNDITEKKSGIPLTIALYIVDAATCEPIPGALVEIWHADVNGACKRIGSR